MTAPQADSGTFPRKAGQDREYFNNNNESTIWLNFRSIHHKTGYNDFPTYGELATALISYDKVFLYYPDSKSLADWLYREPLLIELLECDAVGLATDAYTAGGFDRLGETEGLPENFPHLHKIIQKKQWDEDLFVHFRSQDLTSRDEESFLFDITFRGVDNPTRDYSELFRWMRLAAWRGIEIAGYEEFQEDYKFLMQDGEIARIDTASATQLGIARFFGVPYPSRPMPTNIFEFRQSEAHKGYKEFIRHVEKRTLHQADVRYLNEFITDEIVRTFERDRRRDGYKNLLEVAICAGVDIVARAPIGTVFALAHAFATVAAPNSPPPLEWRAHFKRWTKNTQFD